jgi:hypothetical protein
MFTDVDAWFAELDRFAAEPFMAEGREQPATPARDVFDDDVPARYQRLRRPNQRC